LIEKLLLNPAFVGVIGVVIGSAISLFGTVLSQIILSRKEQNQWENQQKAEKTAWTRNEQKKEKEYLREIYQNSLRLLSVFIALENQKDEEKNKQKKIALLDEIQKWVTMLLLRHASSTLDAALDSFNNYQEEDEARFLRLEIIKLSNKEEGFFLKELEHQSEKNENDVDPNLREIQITINNEFRQEELIEGIEIPLKHTFECKLSEMSNSQRKKLAEIFFKEHHSIPQKFTLFLPFHHDGAKQIAMSGKLWQGRLNPTITKPSDILSAWEKDYERSYDEAKQSLSSIQKSTNA
jgi:hypothetical protein